MTSSLENLKSQTFGQNKNTTHFNFGVPTSLWIGLKERCEVVSIVGKGKIPLFYKQQPIPNSEERRFLKSRKVNFSLSSSGH